MEKVSPPAGSPFRRPLVDRQDAPFGSSVVRRRQASSLAEVFLEVVVTDARGHVDGFLYVLSSQRVEHLVVDVCPQTPAR